MAKIPVGVDIIEQLSHHPQNQPPKVDMVDDVKLLLDGQASKEREILIRTGLGDHIQAAELQQEEFRIYEKMHKQFEEFAVFKLDALEEIAEKFRLYIRPAKDYAGKIPADLGAILVRANEKHNLQLDLSTASTKIVIMAPPPMFKDYRSIGKKFKESISDEKEYNTQRKEAARLARLRRLAERDPAAFLIQGNYAIHLKKWGNDITIFRRILGFIGKTNFFSNLAIISLLTMFVVGGFMATRTFLVGNIIPNEVGFVNAIPDMVTYTDGTTSTHYNAGSLGILAWLFAAATAVTTVVITIRAINFLYNSHKGKHLRNGYATRKNFLYYIDGKPVRY